MDHLLFRAINGLAGHWPWLDVCMLALAEWPVTAGPLLLAGLWFWPGPGRPGRRVAAVLATLAVLVALGLTDLPSMVYQRPRPFDVDRVVLLTRRPPLLPSFPSAHVAVGAALAGALGRWGRFLWALVLGNMGARVFVGVHYPGDVVGGLVLGWVAGAVVYHNRDVLHAFAARVVAMGEELL